MTDYDLLSSELFGGRSQREITGEIAPLIVDRVTPKQQTGIAELVIYTARNSVVVVCARRSVEIVIRGVRRAIGKRLICSKKLRGYGINARCRNDVVEKRSAHASGWIYREWIINNAISLKIAFAIGLT